MKNLIALTLIVFLSACTSISKDVKLISGGKPHSELLVYRPSSFHNGCCSVYIGKGDKYFTGLKNDEYAVIEIDSGTYKLQAKGDGSPASELEVTLSPNQRTCVQAEPNPKTYAAMAIPVIANMVPGFILERVECPQDQFFAKYARVSNS